LYILSYLNIDFCQVYYVRKHFRVPGKSIKNLGTHISDKVVTAELDVQNKSSI